MAEFHFIQIPLAVPAITSLAVLLFLGTWNQCMIAIVLIQDPYQRTMAGALQGFVGQYSTDVVLLERRSAPDHGPVIVVFIIFQKFFTMALSGRRDQGLTRLPPRGAGAGAARTNESDSGTRSPTLQEFRT